MNKTTEKEPNTTVGSSSCKPFDTKNQNLTAEGKLNFNLMNKVEKGFFLLPTNLIYTTGYIPTARDIKVSVCRSKRV